MLAPSALAAALLAAAPAAAALSVATTATGLKTALDSGAEHIVVNNHLSLAVFESLEPGARAAVDLRVGENLSLRSLRVCPCSVSLLCWPGCLCRCPVPLVCATFARAGRLRRCRLARGGEPLSALPAGVLLPCFCPPCFTGLCCCARFRRRQCVCLFWFWSARACLGVRPLLPSRAP